MSVPDRERLAQIALVVLDVDGVLTDGALIYGSSGEELKAFHVRDGAGIAALKRAGIAVAVISGRDSEPLRRRLDDLGIDERHLACRDKAAALAQVRGALELSDEAGVLVVGDDMQDLPMLVGATIAVAVADAAEGLARHADWITSRRGGHGAVREVADALLAARAPSSFRVVIPSRYDASRLPGKPLRAIAGRPMIAHVIDRARESGAAEIVVATDDARIEAAVQACGGVCQMTSSAHASGTDRIAEVARVRGWPASDIVVNLQGDEPALPGELVRTVADALALAPWASIATMATPIADPNELVDPNAVKVTVATSGRALLFSRSPIPWVRGEMAWGQVPTTLPSDVPFLRHIGLYAYRVGDLLSLAETPPAPLELAESLEQLRALSRGLDIHVTIVKKAPPSGVDTENDLARIERLMSQRADS